MGHLEKGRRLGLPLGVERRCLGLEDRRVAEELPAGCCGAPRERRLMQSVISIRQKTGHGHCQLSGFYCKPQATRDFLGVVVPRMKRFCEDFFSRKQYKNPSKQVPSPLYSCRKVKNITKDILNPERKKIIKPPRELEAQHTQDFSFLGSTHGLRTTKDSCTALRSKGKKTEHCKASCRCPLDTKADTLRKYSGFSSSQGYQKQEQTKIE